MILGVIFQINDVLFDFIFIKECGEKCISFHKNNSFVIDKNNVSWFLVSSEGSCDTENSPTQLNSQAWGAHRNSDAATWDVCLICMYLFVIHVAEKAKGINYKGVFTCFSELSVIFMIHLLPSALF